MDNEIWKDIAGYEGLYQISNFGKVKSLKRLVNRKSKNGKWYKRFQEEIILNPDKKSNYCRVVLQKEKKKRHYSIHILVAEHFIPNPENKTEVHHIDGDKTNNKVENLMWVTKKEHADLHFEKFEKMAKAAAKVCSKMVLQYTKDGQFIAEFPSIMEASRQTGISFENISACCRKVFYPKWGYTVRSAGGFIWRYA